MNVNCLTLKQLLDLCGKDTLMVKKEKSVCFVSRFAPEGRAKLETQKRNFLCQLLHKKQNKNRFFKQKT